MKSVIVTVICLAFAGFSQLDAAAMTFENIKALYEKNGHRLTMKMPDGKQYDFGAIFKLPEEQQRTAWDAWMKKTNTSFDHLRRSSKAQIQSEVERWKLKTSPQQQKDIHQALQPSVKKYHKACLQGNELACMQLGGNYYRGVMLKHDFKKARKYFYKACTIRGNSGMGCYYLSQIYYAGYGVKRNRKEAKRYAAHACKLGYKEACSVIKQHFPD